MRHLSFAPFVIASLLLSNAAAAQTGVPDQKTPRVNIVSTNPVGILFEFYNGEIEHALLNTASVAVAGSHVTYDRNAYTTGDLILRYYPSARAVRGFAFGVSVGFARATTDEYCGYQCVDARTQTHDNAFTVGVRGDYIWILGSDQRFSVATGVGAKRLFYSSGDHSGSEGLPIGRLSIGYAW